MAITNNDLNNLTPYPVSKPSTAFDDLMDIQNNLTSTSATKPLSANQGKILNDKFTTLAIKEVKTGSLTMATTTNNQYITQEITFDTPFTSAVVVGFANPRTGDPRAVSVAVNTINQNRIMISLSRLAAGSTYIDWIAFGI